MKKITSILVIFLTAFLSLHAQSMKVSGIVLDETNYPMVGVGVIEKGNTSNGTVTDIDGKFSLTVSDIKSVLSLSYIGYESMEVAVQSAPMTITMTPSSLALDDVVVVAYGVQKKESVVGAISTTTSEDLVQMGSPNLSTALAGQVAGVTFTVPSGLPGDDDAEIYVRGIATLNGNSSPLVLVDGVEREYSQIDPEDIASLSVLKDASATAVYGVRGANGVILITTKRGQKGAPKFNVSYKFTLQQPTRIPTFLGSYDHAILRNESLANDGALPSFTPEDIEHYRLGDSPYTHPDNDYVKDFLRKVTPMHKLNVNVSGGTDFVKYYVALNGLIQDGIYKQFDGKYPSNANFKRINLRANLDFNLTKTTVLSLDLNGRLEQKQNNTNEDANNIFAMMYETPPMAYPYLLPDGTYGASDITKNNILAMLSDWGYVRNTDNVLEGTVKLKQDLKFITKGLSARAQVSFNSYYGSGTKISYRPPTYKYVSPTEKIIMQDEVVPSISSIDGKGHRRRTNIEAGLDYARTFGDHEVTAMALYTQTQSNTNANLPQAFLGVAARATYAYKEKYLAEVNLGYNGSDQFDKEHRYALFPSFALGYVISNERFFKEKVPFLTFMKLRATYGEVGNDKIGSDRFIYLQTYEKDGQYFFGKDNAFGGMSALKEGDLGNTNVTWEVGKKANVGLDLEFFDKLSFNFDIFQENRERIFIARNTTPQTLGVGTAKENLGRVRNRGFEVEAAYKEVVNSNFDWYISGMFSYSQNKVLYKDEVEPKYEYLRQTGKAVGQFFGQTVLRYYTPDDFIMVDGVRTLNPELPQPQYAVQPGDFMYWDRNGDMVIDSFDEGPIGKTKIPEFIYNLTFGFNLHNFDFNMMWQGAGGVSKLMTKSLYEPVREENRFQEIHLYRWTEERWRNGEEILYPRLSSATNQHNHCTNTFYLKDGSYLRLKSIEIGYTFSKKMLRVVGLNSLRIYVGGNNLLTFSEIKNFDPEMGDATGYFYPQMKMWNFGVNINF